MYTDVRTQQLGWLSLLVSLTLVICPGCRKDEDRLSVQTLEGKVDKIVVESGGTGEITVLYFSERHGQEVRGIGKVTKDTEIIINGAIAKLSDIREGERVRGEVQVETQGNKKVQTVLRIYIDRPEPVAPPG
ncbi:MAG: hypothetical protein KJ749_06470 [Planctomycetes bacterium]|nr:hypothetical protein [Planctomycetota bacterium]